MYEWVIIIKNLAIINPAKLTMPWAKGGAYYKVDT